MNDFINDLIQSRQKVTVITLTTGGAPNSAAAIQYDGVILSCDSLGIVMDCGKGVKAGIPYSAMASVVPFSI